MAEYFGSEVERRRWAVLVVTGGGGDVRGAAQQAGRSERWLHKWLRRYETAGEEGLRDLPRTPHRCPGATRPEVVEKILAVRRFLEAHPFANRGAEAVRYELIREGYQPLPSRSTIERVLARAGATRRGRREPRIRDPRPLPQVAVPGVWQQIDWVGPRYLAKRVRFSSLNLVDAGGGGAAAAQYPDERLGRTVGFLTERAWPALSIPWHLQTDGAFVAQPPGTGRRPFNLFVRCCLFFGVEVIISPPQELGWQNWVESFNGLWQARTIRRHPYTTPEEVAADSDRFISYYLWERPHPQLRVSTHGTRFPGELINFHRPHLRFPPPGFSVADYTDRQNRLHLPLSRGRLTYLRRVQDGGVIEVARALFPVPASTVGLVVSATILTASRRLIIRHDGDTIATHRFPISEKAATPYHPTATRSLFHNPPH